MTLARAISHSRNAGLMRLRFERPQHSNGIDEDTMEALEAALVELETSEALSCLVLEGSGGVFSTGLDGDLLTACFTDPAQFAAASQRLARIAERLEALPQITIASIDGTCRLGGLELALACDLVVAGEGAEISDGHLDFDAFPGGGGTKRLPARLGYPQALRFLLDSPVLDARAARDLGLVDMYAPEGATRAALALAGVVTAHDPELMRALKASLRAAAPAPADRSFQDAFRRAVIDRLVPG